VKLRLKYLIWGKNIWRSDATHCDDEPTSWWSLYGRQKAGIEDGEDFSQGLTETSYRLRFYSYWPEDLSRKGIVGKYSLPSVSDKFSSRKDAKPNQCEPVYANACL